MKRRWLGRGKIPRSGRRLIFRKLRFRLVPAKPGMLLQRTMTLPLTMRLMLCFIVFQRIARLLLRLENFRAEREVPSPTLLTAALKLPLLSFPARFKPLIRPPVFMSPLLRKRRVVVWTVRPPPRALRKKRRSLVPARQSVQVPVVFFGSVIVTVNILRLHLWLTSHCSVRKFWSSPSKSVFLSLKNVGVTMIGVSLNRQKSSLFGFSLLSNTVLLFQIVTSIGKI